VKFAKPQFKTITKTFVLEPYKNMAHFAENTIPAHTTLQEILSRRVYNHTLQEIEERNEYIW